MNHKQNEIRTTSNSTYKKLAVQWFNEALCFVSKFSGGRQFRASKSPTSCSCKTFCPWSGAITVPQLTLIFSSPTVAWFLNHRSPFRANSCDDRSQFFCGAVYFFYIITPGLKPGLLMLHPFGVSNHLFLQAFNVCLGRCYHRTTTKVVDKGFRDEWHE